MPDHDGLMRIFWPLDLSRTDAPGIIVGWRNSGLDVFVVAVLEDVDARSVENALKVGTLFRNSSHPMTRIFELCGQSSMHVLGLANAPQAEVELLQIQASTGPHLRKPQISCARASTIQIIMFERPLPGRMQYISLDPISLALGDKAEMAIHAPGSMDAEEERAELKNRQRTKQLVRKLKLHTVAKHPPSQKELALPRIVSQVNCSWELHMLLQKNISLVGRRSRRSLSVSERVVESATSMRDFVVVGTWHLITLYIYPIIRRGFIIMLLCHRVVAEALLLVLEWRAKPEYAALKDISATAQQVEIRLQQFCYWPMQYITLRKRKNDWESVTTSHPDYIRFYNSLWLVANDVIIGIALGSYIIDNSAWVAESISNILSRYSIAALQRTISWLMDWPAGLKLNNELAAFLGDLFLWVIDYWASCIEALRPVLPHLIWFIGFSSFAGASMPIALFSDLLSIVTLHIHSFYMASARIFNWQYTILLSLFQLFRGKKHNVLRKRIDSCDYDLDQLLLGTILFTLLFFLLPTVIVFYLTFACSRMAIISLKAVLDTLLACLNHFPLFALMLRIKDSRRLPGGIRFELKDTQPLASSSPDSPNPPPTSYIYLKSVPLTFRDMFHQYFQLSQRIRKHYLSPRVLLCLATGKFVPPIHRKNLYSLQYSMLPARRADIGSMWNALTASTTTSA
ncbi:N-acetylglucosaminyl transferas-like protein component Gpi1 [Venustampulla echinocandica]|uniref:N-acetylglucosaminyl transferas-like protein component Gpi1 n=1 Tax=Venustampulla echinocandica TaxID=2656787 RepID=A0A370TDJ1_9HELO|nr:N-acetylglucosaminyl transferas-like protein component Gpi1 [Venustampulla echinocandica]RDL32540.1 N-acetylglucosaminyl transferas-like protein component Gpi1 [Venustampulla echinocandica]